MVHYQGELASFDAVLLTICRQNGKRNHPHLVADFNWVYVGLFY